MNFKFLFLLPFVALLAGCGASKKTTTDSDVKDIKINNPYGMKYKLYKHTAGRTAKEGEIVDFDLMLFSPKDSAIFSTYHQGAHIVMPLEKHKFNGDFMDGISLLSPGDSADFFVSTDSLIKMNQTADFIHPGESLRYNVKLYGIYSRDEYQKKLQDASKGQDKKDSALIADYLKKNNLKAEKTESGLYYVITEQGTGPNAQPGQKVFVHYTGKLLNGQKFDSSLDRGQPLSFTLGAGQVIRGWDEGLSLLNKGAKAILLIPSSLGYGSQDVGNGMIPANSVLIFDVQLVDVK
jgi:FKBP-type peptidyl-prolyl cis-trans isomerase